MQLEYDGPPKLMANELFTAKLRITPDCDLRGGDRIVIAVRHISDFGDPQMNVPQAENYVSVTGPGCWELGETNDWKRHPWNRGIELRLTAGAVAADGDIVVTLGDREGGSPGYRSQSFAETRFTFRLGILAGGRQDWQVMDPDACPSIRVTGNQVSRLRVVVSNPTNSDVTRRVHLKPEDSYGNVAHEVPGEAAILVDDGLPLRDIRLMPDEATVTSVSISDSPSWRRITVATDDGRFWARSNPFGPSPMKGLKLFFGDIHSQSGLCDGTNVPSEAYRYARDAAGLDFASVTSHDFELTPEDWKQIQEATREAHRPGEFVTFLGYEWSGRTPAGGDNNFYFLADEAPLIYSAPYPAYPTWDPAQGHASGSRTLSEVILELRGTQFMAVPHCGGRRCNLDFYDASVMPLFEIHSCHRTYEHVAHESIRRGIRFGFIGGSDDHRGALGDSHPAARERFFSSHSGLVAAYATNLTRESLWEAFFARRVYATNGPRIALTVTIDGQPMGSDLVCPPATRLKLSFWTCLDGMLDRVEVMRDDALIQTFQGTTNQIGDFSGEMEVRAAEVPSAYYIKVFQTDGGRAWSSPIWVLSSDKKDWPSNQALHSDAVNRAPDSSRSKDMQ